MSPSTALATSPGRTLTMANVSMETATSTRTRSPTRRKMKLRTGTGRRPSGAQPDATGLDRAEFWRHEALHLVAGDADVVLKVRYQTIRVFMDIGQHSGRYDLAFFLINFGNHIVQFSVQPRTGFDLAVVV